MGAIGAIVVEWYIFNDSVFLFKNPVVMLIVSFVFFVAAGFIATKIYDASLMAGYLNTAFKRGFVILGLIFIQFIVATIIRMAAS